MKAFRFLLSKDCDTVILATALYHDRNTSSIVMDGYVVFQSDPRTQEMLQSMPQDEFLNRLLSKEEVVRWKQLMPCLVEKCRQSWAHRKDCEYRLQNQIPLSTSQGVAPLCSCGEGKSLDWYPAGARYRGLARYATRIAIPPVFAVPYVEPLILPSDAPPPRQGPETPGPGYASTIGKCGACVAKKTNLKACVRCHVVQYCNHKCQKSAWKEHKKICNK